MTSLLKQWENSDLREIKQIIYHSKANDESFPKMFVWGGDFSAVLCLMQSLMLMVEAPSFILNRVAKIISVMTENDLCDIFRIRTLLKHDAHGDRKIL